MTFYKLKKDADSDKRGRGRGIVFKNNKCRFSGNGQWHSSLLLLMMTIMVTSGDTIMVRSTDEVMLVTTMIMDHLLLLLTAS